jgi:hypothetical protein
MVSEWRGHYTTIKTGIVQQAQFKKIKSDVYCTEFDTANWHLLQYTALQSALVVDRRISKFYGLQN